MSSAPGRPPRGLRPIDVVADLTLTVDGRPVRVTANGPRVTVDAPDARTAWALGQPGRLVGRAGLAGAARALAAMGVHVDLHVGGRPVGSVGPGRAGRVRVRPVVPVAAQVGAALAAVVLVAVWLRRRP